MKRDRGLEETGVTLPAGAKQPFIDPRVPKGALTPADAYRAGAEARMKGRIAKMQTPVAGGPGPRIPRLDTQPAQEGMTMQQHAELSEQSVLRQMEALKQAQRGGFVEPPVGTPRLNLLAGDILPPAAQQDPDFISGHGALLAINQPHLAQKYGVIRGGKPLAPQQLMAQLPGRPALSPETLKDLETLRQLEESQKDATKLNEEEAPGELGAAAGRVGNLPGDNSEKPLSEGERRELQKAVDGMDEFEFDAWRQSMMKDLLNNPEQKKIIEGRVLPMDVGDLVVAGYVTQNVPIIPNKFEVQFRTTDGQSDLAIKRLIMEDSKSLEVSERYYLDKFSLMSMAALLYAINKKVLPDHRNENGEFDDELFRKKFKMVIKLPYHMLASIGVHAMWFEERVRKLFVVEKVGNG